MSRSRRTWAPCTALVGLAGGWYAANLLAYAASLRTLRAADAKIAAFGGHAPVFANLPSVWDWQVQQSLRSAMFGVLGAATIAILLRRVSRWPWFLLAAAVPIIVGHTEHLHGWWAPGPGIDQWTFGAGFATPGLDLTRYGAGPWWTVVGGTFLAAAAVVVPALLVRPLPALAPRPSFVRAVPYVALLTVGTALATGALHIDDSGDGSSHEMLVAAAATALFATVAAFIAPKQWFWRDTSLMAAAAGLVTVSGLNPSAMPSTKSAAFAAAAGVVIVAALAARRPNLRIWSTSPAQRTSEP